MTIIANAFPKCGTNLVKKTLGAMGLRHHDGGLVRHNMGEMSRFVVPNGDGTKRQEPIHEVLTLPEDDFIHAHLCYGGDLPIAGAKMIFIHRDPRDAAISMLRTGKTGLSEDKAALLSLVVNGVFSYGPWARAWGNFMCWSVVPWVLTVRFDAICADGGATVAAVADYLGVRGVDAPRIAKGLYGHGKSFEGRDVYEGDSTWTGREPSSWRTCGYWDEQIEDAWRQTGGDKIEQMHGYGDVAKQG